MINVKVIDFKIMSTIFCYLLIISYQMFIFIF